MASKMPSRQKKSHQRTDVARKSDAGINPVEKKERQPLDTAEADAVVDAAAVTAVAEASELKLDVAKLKEQIAKLKDELERKDKAEKRNKEQEDQNKEKRSAAEKRSYRTAEEQVARLTEQVVRLKGELDKRDELDKTKKQQNLSQIDTLVLNSLAPRCLQRSVLREWMYVCLQSLMFRVLTAQVCEKVGGEGGKVYRRGRQVKNTRATRQMYVHTHSQTLTPHSHAREPISHTLAFCTRYPYLSRP